MARLRQRNGDDGANPLTRVAVVGAAGELGGRLISDLAANAAVSEVVAIDADSDRLITNTDSDPFSKTTAVVSALDEDGIRKAVDGAQIVVGSLSDPAPELAAARAAVDAGASYVSGCYDPATIESIFELDASAKDAGVTVIPGIGWTPGLTNMMVRHAAASLDRVRSARISWVASIASLHEETFVRVARALSGTSVALSGGGWARRAAGEEEEEIFFPPPIGWRQVRLAENWEAQSLPRTIEGVEDVVVKAGITEGALDTLARAVSAIPALSSRDGRTRMASILGPAVPLLGRLSGARHSWSAARVDVAGTRDGGPVSISLAVLDQTANLLCAPVVAAALALAGGRGTPGVHSPEEVLDPSSFFHSIARAGVRIAKLSR